MLWKLFQWHIQRQYHSGSSRGRGNPAVLCVYSDLDRRDSYTSAVTTARHGWPEQVTLCGQGRSFFPIQEAWDSGRDSK